MKTYVVEQYEVVVRKWEVKANTKEEAIGKAINNEVENSSQSDEPDFVENAEEYGMSLDEVKDKGIDIDRLEKITNTRFKEIVHSIASVEEKN